ncbi:hypothetical protein CPAR01_13428 [Colletotrichum paranaense]|uniref:Uncharacterized protein n=1 Tax=Colletotrichum paranaense TaxID=1914294 RepID=A0ABQ9S6N5_9PEZI|nr:uncharacterized protein CPAR01_13428 [Colletotrichum paranaense]KAK1526900.1 hypothetical protein CPAR01_13428 [Colletotrichum paranaense]
MNTLDICRLVEDSGLGLCAPIKQYRQPLVDSDLTSGCSRTPINKVHDSILEPTSARSPNAEPASHPATPPSHPSISSARDSAYGRRIPRIPDSWAGNITDSRVAATQCALVHSISSEPAAGMAASVSALAPSEADHVVGREAARRMFLMLQRVVSARGQLQIWRLCIRGSDNL